MEKVLIQKYQLLLLTLLLTANNPLITKDLTDVSPASIKSIEKLEHKNSNSKISEITKTSLVMVMEAILSHLRIRLTLTTVLFLLKSINTDLALVDAFFKSNPSSTPFPIITSIESIICVTLILNIFNQASKQASDIQNMSYDLINKEISTKKVLIKFSSLIGFLTGCCDGKLLFSFIA